MRLAASLFALGLVTLPCASAGAQDPVPGWRMGAPIELADLLDACATLLATPIEYQRSEVSGEVTLRIEREMDVAEIWQVTQQALNAKGLTTIQQPGSRVLQVVQLSAAASLARLEQPTLIGARAGFVKVLLQLERTKPEEVSSMLQLLLSKSGSLTNTKEGFLVADLYPHARQLVVAAINLDTAPAPLSVVEVAVRHSSPVTLVALIERIGQASKSAGGEVPKGTLLALPERQAILLLAVEEDRAFWEDRIRQFDRPQEAYAVAYSPRRFGVEETAGLLEQSIEHGDRPWKIVLDELTGSIVLSTTADLHIEAKTLVERLESAALGPRRAVRAFELKHRSVASVAKLIDDLVARGALSEIGDGTGPAPSPTSPPNTSNAPNPAAPAPGKESAAIVSGGPRPSIQATADLLITVDEPANRLVALGEGRLLDQLGLLIQSLDVSSPQVLVETLVVNLSDTKTRELAVELQKITDAGSNLFRLSSLFGLGSPDPASAAAIPPATGIGGTGVVLRPGDFSALVRALETVNEGRVVTIPKVLVGNNEQASLGSTLQTPFVSTNASNTVATTSFGGSLDAGTTISVKPQIAAGDQLVLTYSVSLSSFVGQAAAPEVPPPRQENRIESVATVPDGHCVVIGGLEIESDTMVESRVPWLGSIPLFGSLFKSESKTKQRSRFFVFLRCSVLRGDRLEDLRYVSQAPLREAGIDDGWPRLEPRVIR